ncbi:hypothetical protein [Caballeronia sp. GaOx3]|uniref:hypothetical protein n=1 Tax=Caballeronia sp. GaOx3 TaxID=2921740 RepID=UPI002027B95B|nr:hypothetical protein [Caballeronia sp. GaOx3]
MTSESGVKIQTKLGGEAAVNTTFPTGKAGVSIQFSGKVGFIFQASDCYIDEIDDKIRLGEKIATLFESGRWKKEWGIVDTLVRAGAATILVSNSTQAALELTAKASVDPAALVKLHADFDINVQSGDIIRFLAQKSMTPLFKRSRIKPTFFRSLGLNNGRIRFGGGREQSQTPTPANNELAHDMIEAIFEAIEPSPGDLRGIG